MFDPSLLSLTIIQKILSNYEKKKKISINIIHENNIKLIILQPKTQE